MGQNKPKTLHAIAHFDFDGRCLDCPCAWWSKEVADGTCQLNNEEIFYEGRHKDCPLCIEEEEDE